MDCLNASCILDWCFVCDETVGGTVCKVVKRYESEGLGGTRMVGLIDSIAFISFTPLPTV